MAKDIQKRASIHYINGIFHIDGYPPAMLDKHVAEIYGVETKHLNQAARRQVEKSLMSEPEDRFSLSGSLKSQFVTSLKSNKIITSALEVNRGFSLYTRDGANSMAFALNSEEARQRRRYILRTFDKAEKQDRQDQKLLDMLFLEEGRSWRRLFGNEFFDMLGRLREGQDFKVGSWRSYFLADVSAVYSRLPERVMEEVRKACPMKEATETGRKRYAKTLHQHFTDEGRELVKSVVTTALTVGKCSHSYRDFQEKWDRVWPPFGGQIPLLLTHDMKKAS